MISTNKKNIAILMGGTSVEREISIKSGEHFFSNLNLDEFNAYKIFLSEDPEWLVRFQDKTYKINKTDFSFYINDEVIRFDAAIILIHGEPAENGELSKYFDSLNIPYNCCNEHSSLLTFNKYNCNSFLRTENFNVPKSIINSLNIENFNFPCIVKPTTSGSSFGVTKVNFKNYLTSAVEHAKKYSNKFIIEEFIEGREICCAVHDLEDGKLTSLALTEIISENEIFDYNAKYLGESKEITPANLDEKLSLEIKTIAEKAYSKLNLKGIVRFDFILRDEIAYIIEVNTIPGFSKESIVPKMIKASNLEIKDFVSKLLNRIII